MTRAGDDALIDRRIGNRVAIFGLLLAAAVNIVTVVWFAASLNAAVGGLIESNKKRDVLETVLAQQVQTIAQQLAVVSDRVMRNSDKIESK